MSAQHPIECMCPDCVNSAFTSVCGDDPLPELPEINSGRVPPPPVVPVVRRRPATGGAVGARGSRWVFTWNYEEQDEGMIRARLEKMVQVGSDVQYLIYGKEVAPTTGQKHFQGYVEVKKTMRLRAMKEIFLQCVHMEVAIATCKLNQEYCKKEGSWVEHGAPKPGQGARVDLMEIKGAMDDGMSLTGVSQAYFGQFLRYHRGFERYQSLNAVPSGRGGMIIKWFWGPTGSGKTSALNTNVELLGKDHYGLQTSPTGTWWNGYDGQEVVVMDELRAGWFPHSVLLRVLDRAAYRVPCHGASVALCATHILISSSKPPQDLYAEDFGGQLCRRIRDYGYVYELRYDVTLVKNVPRYI